MRAMTARVPLALAAVTGILMLAGCEKDSSLGDNHDFQDNDPAVIVAMGDSITHGLGVSAAASYPAQLAGMVGKTVYNQGIDGAQAFVGAGAVNGVLTRYKPGFLLVLYGANDVIRGADMNSAVASIRSILIAARARGTIPIVGTLTPMTASHVQYDSGARALSQRIREMAAADNFVVADLANAIPAGDPYFQADGLHPTETGCAQIARVFAGIIK